MIVVNSCFLYLGCVHLVQLRDLSLCGFSWVIKRSSNSSESSSPLLTGTFIEKTFMEPLLHERPCVSSGDTGRSRTPPHLEQWSRNCSHRRKMERYPLIPQNRATWGEVVGLQKEHWSVSARARAVWGFGKLEFL